MWTPGLLFSSFAQDLRFALQLMRRNRAFSGIAILTLALGIGANTAVFSLFDAVVVHPLPYPQPGSALRAVDRRGNIPAADEVVVPGLSRLARAGTFLHEHRGLPRHLVQRDRWCAG